MTELAILVIGAMITEQLVEILKGLIKDGKVNRSVLISLLIGIGVAATYNLDLMLALGVTAVVPFVGVVLTGILISAGAGAFYDLLQKLKGDQPY